MRTFIATETKIYKSNEEFYASNSFGKVLERYKNNFGLITLCTRIINKNKQEIPDSYENVTNLIDDSIQIDNLISFVRGKNKNDIQKKLKGCDLVIARVPSIIAYKVANIAKKKSIPYLVEVVGCAWDAYWNYSIQGKLVSLFAYLLMRKTVYRANYATYVTENFLQKRYPCRCESIHCSNVYIEECTEKILNKRIEKIRKNDYKKELKLITCAAVDVTYKGQEYVIKSIPLLKKMGINIRYELAGYGRQDRLKKIAEKCGVSDNVIFLGPLSKTEVYNSIDQTDIYIQPSLQEGLPRSVIEAMSRACPVLGANTAGIPELISYDCIFKRKSPKDIAKKVKYLYDNNMELYAKNNYIKSKEFLTEVLEKRRTDYYNKIKESIKVR